VVRGSAWLIASWDVLQWGAGVVEAGGERVTQAVRAELPGGLEVGVSGEATHEPPRLGFVHPSSLFVEEQCEAPRHW